MDGPKIRRCKLASPYCASSRLCDLLRVFELLKFDLQWLVIAF